jgi:glycine/D-amino acid oxidase-like deaminating enzyme
MDSLRSGTELKLRRGTRRCNTVVVGGGLTGCAAAYELARAGVDVLLIERGSLNS